MANPNPSPATRFKPGRSGNPAGRRRGARDRLTVALLEALAGDFEHRGTDFIARLRTERPDLYVRLLVAIVPRDARFADPCNGVGDMGDDLAGYDLDSLIDARRRALALANV